MSEPNSSDASPAPTAAAMPATPVDPLSNAPLTYPDDGGFERALRWIDKHLGLLEHALLFGILMTVVLTASAQAIRTKIFHSSFDWSFEIVRDGVFAIAMLGAAFASQQQRHLAMDLLSKRLSPRGRLALRISLGLFVIVVVGFFVRAGWHLRALTNEGGHHTIDIKHIATLVPIGAALIVTHTLLQLLIDASYLVRGKLPPEKLRLSH